MKIRLLPLTLALCAVTLLAPTPARAGSATWSGQLNSNWNVFQNWSPQMVPNGPSDTATMAGSNNRTVYLSASTEVNGITFPRPFFPTAVNYAITVSPGLTLTISGAGISNNSGQAQNFVTSVASGQAGLISFTNNATASTATFTNNASTNVNEPGGQTTFSGSATAGNGRFINNPGIAGPVRGTGSSSGRVIFLNTSTAGNGSFTSSGGIVNGQVGGQTIFNDTSTAGNATLTNEGATVSGALGGFTEFAINSTAGSATLIANAGTGGGDGGAIYFRDDSDGVTSRVEVFGNGRFHIDLHNLPGLMVGSIEGNGNFVLGANNLVVGSNNLSTVCSGLIQDEDGGGGLLGGGTGGSLTKMGTGTLTLSRANTYTGGTTITDGTLAVKNSTGSATGPGAVQVNFGTLKGTGKIDGAVTVGNGSISGAILLAGNGAKTAGTLTINNTLTFNSTSIFKCGLKRTTSGTGQVTAVAGKVTALGVTINSNAPFTFVDSGTGILPVGTVFTIINNTSASPIAGRFSNLANGLTFASNGNTFKVNYTGGTGNDLTLRVVQ